jgi:hypothetical protein
MDPPKNGRVDTLYGENYNIYSLFQETKRPEQSFGKEAIKGTHSGSDLNQIFFSKVNIDAIQSAIRYQVYIKSCKKHTIDRQSDTDLKVVMRSVYLQEARHGSRDILAEVRRLNGLVVDFCAPRIIQEINMYMHYRADISRLPTPMERGEFISSKGTRTLETKQF